MAQLQPVNTSRLFSVSGTFGDAQIVATSSRVLLDLQTRNYNSAGVLHKQHALANMPLDTATRLRDLLNQAIAAATDATQHQPGLWSDSAVSDIARRLA